MSYNKKGYPKTSFQTAPKSTTSVLVGVGTTVFFDEIVTKVGINYCKDVGAANALIGYVTDVVTGASFKPETGTMVIIKTSNALQAGANTFNFNGHGTDSIVSQNNPSDNLASVVVAGAMLLMIFDGSKWQAVGY